MEPWGGGGGNLREKGDGAFSGFFLVRKTKKKRKEKGTREKEKQKKNRENENWGGAGEGAKYFPIIAKLNGISLTLLEYASRPYKPTGSRRL